MTGNREVSYTDELLADRTVHRRYSGGRQEWRRLVSLGLVEWHTDGPLRGRDEMLGRNILKRTFQNGKVIYGRDVGYGRTMWRQHPSVAYLERPAGLVMTWNRTSFGGRVGAVLAGLGASVLLGPVVAPPDTLTIAQEEELRRAAQQGSSGGDGGNWGDGSSDGGSGGSDGDGDGWDDTISDDSGDFG